MNGTKIWHSVSVSVQPEYVEAAEFAFNELDALGTEVDLLTNKDSELCTVSAYFDHPPDKSHVRNQMEEAARIYDLAADIDFAIQQDTIGEQDWLAEWKKYWKPVEIGKFVIAAPWHEVAADKTVIRIEPNMAFGTGTHETTQLCLEAISKLYEPGFSFLDVGTGTGILAIAAAKIANRDGVPMLAIDNDPDSITIALENVEMNGVADLIDVRAGTLEPDTPSFDFVCANLTADVIVPILPLLLEKTKHTLILSGILTEQQDLVTSGITTLFSYSVDRAGEWISVTAQRK